MPSALAFTAGTISDGSVDPVCHRLFGFALNLLKLDFIFSHSAAEQDAYAFFLSTHSP